MDNSGNYISREAAREAVWQILNGMGYSEKHNDRLVEEVDLILDDLPAADVRPVVLCQNCYLHGKCATEDVFKFAGLSADNRFCGVGRTNEAQRLRKQLALNKLGYPYDLPKREEN